MFVEKDPSAQGQGDKRDSDGDEGSTASGGENYGGLDENDSVANDGIPLLTEDRVRTRDGREGNGGSTGVEFL